jgi:lysozyme family protein
MQGDFDRAVAVVFRLEGGYVSHPLDPGGPTRFGVTKATLARARGRPVSDADVMALDQSEAKQIYRARYWDAVRADALPAGVDLAVFDCAVNSGPGRALALLRQALALPRSDERDAATLEAARRADPARLISEFCRLRLGFLQRLPTWPVFGRGWTRRVGFIEREALAMAGVSARPPASGGGPAQESNAMDLVKPILQSRTVWSNLIGLAAVSLSALGYDTSQLDAGKFADTGLQVVAGLSFIASTAFRIVATRRLS